MNADRLVERGNELTDQGLWEEAAAAYHEAARLDPQWSVPWYNLGLNHKRQRRWRESLEANRRALALEPSDLDAWWNLGIAATALGDWSAAREAWRGFGLDIPDGEGPLELDYGMVPVRLNPEDGGEVVWSHRVDPARAIVANVPYARSGFCEGDVVLHDGAPNGYRVLDGREIPVFDVLERLERSPRRTTEARLLAPDAAAVEALIARVDAAGGVAEDWTASVANLCRLCSEGVPHVEHVRAGAWERERHLGLSCASPEQARQLLEVWAGEDTGRVVLHVETAQQPE